jgi:hypothetical protein
MSTTTSAGGALARTSDSPDTIAPKGLRSGIIGLLGSTVLGVVQTAPAYSIAVTLGLAIGPDVLNAG